MLRSYNATYVAMERMAAFCHSVPLVLDEQQTVRNNRYFDMDTLIYNLCEGQGKGRGTKGGSLENLSTWRLCILSSGEGPLTTARSGGGGKNRVLEIYCREKLFADAPRVAELVKVNYGHAGRAYMRALSQPETLDTAKRLFDGYRTRLFAAENGTEKQSTAAALLAVGDHLSAEIIFGQAPEEAGRSAAAFCQTLAERYLSKASDVSQVERAYQWVCGWIASNPGNFIQDGAAGWFPGGKTELWGKRTGDRCAVIYSQLEKALEGAGFIVDACVKGFTEKEYLIPGPREARKQLRIGSDRPRCYELVMPSIGAETMDELFGEEAEDPWGPPKTVLFPGGGA